eukprot:scaffold651809_cov52-Prasinocladus_malaysianus.AAC.1
MLSDDQLSSTQVDIHRVYWDEQREKVRIDWDYHSSPAAEPFAVEPPEAMIPAGATAAFTASFSQLGTAPAGAR